MKQLVFLLWLMFGVAAATAQPLQEPLVGPTVTISDVYNVADEMPQFPGGQPELSKYLIKNIKYPDMARECDCQGRVFVSFVVDIDGSVTDVQPIRKANSCAVSVCYNADKKAVPCSDPAKASQAVECDVSNLLDKEAVRVVKGMPKWVPGKVNDKPVKVKYNLPIKFVLE